ncbi:hypothetical protein FACS1894122_04700 [Alphaproteobacteria bacterium]|nr:hypothetical protein FACS1894122_04700 [Alphaproteobacteria bacterium]
MKLQAAVRGFLILSLFYADSEAMKRDVSEPSLPPKSDSESPPPKSGEALKKFREGVEKVIQIRSVSPPPVSAMISEDDSYLETLNKIFKSRPSHQDLQTPEYYSKEGVSSEIVEDIRKYHSITKTEYNLLQDRMVLLVKICHNCLKCVDAKSDWQQALIEILSTASAKCTYIAMYFLTKFARED